MTLDEQAISRIGDWLERYSYAYNQPLVDDVRRLHAIAVAELDGHFVVYAWDRNDTHQCLLEHCGLESAEVLDGETDRTSDGNLIMWNERNRRPVK